MGWLKSRERRAPRRAAEKVDTVVGPGAVFEGALVSPRGVCVEGVLRGRLECGGPVILNPGGRLEADVEADHVVVHGELVGNVTAREQLDIGPTGVVRGEVEAASVTVAKGGVLQGACRMPEGAARPVEAAPPPRQAQGRGRSSRADPREEPLLHKEGSPAGEALAASEA
ncbi:MAG: hypothetical protein Kow0092_03180 [Deferrisomatales bacterium]